MPGTTLADRDESPNRRRFLASLYSSSTSGPMALSPRSRHARPEAPRSETSGSSSRRRLRSPPPTPSPSRAAPRPAYIVDATANSDDEEPPLAPPPPRRSGGEPIPPPRAPTPPPAMRPRERRVRFDTTGERIAFVRRESSSLIRLLEEEDLLTSRRLRRMGSGSGSRRTGGAGTSHASGRRYRLTRAGTSSSLESDDGGSSRFMARRIATAATRLGARAELVRHRDGPPTVRLRGRDGERERRRY